MVRLVGSRQPGVLGIPLEVAAIHDAAAHLRGMTVHVLRRGVRHDVGSPLKGAAVDGCGERVVDYQGHPVTVGDACELLDVEHFAARVRDGLAEQRLRVGTEGSVYLLLGSLLRHEGAVYA